MAELTPDFLERHKISWQEPTNIDDFFDCAASQAMQYFLIDYMIKYHDYSIAKCADLIKIARNTANDWYNKKRPAKNSVIRRGIRKARNKFKGHFNERIPSPNHLDLLGIIVLVDHAKSTWFPDVDSRDAPLDPDLLKILFFLFKNDFLSIDRKHDAKKTGEIFKTIKMFKFTSNFDDARIAQYLCVWLKPFVAIRCLAPDLFGGVEIDYPEFC